jgi:hypothetical protein
VPGGLKVLALAAKCARRRIERFAARHARGHDPRRLLLSNLPRHHFKSENFVQMILSAADKPRRDGTSSEGCPARPLESLGWP